ncbi:MAG: DUF2975 domain-containing protein [Eubacteriales bacterium]|nr:DUF2975 domain-containing protein [Eubacteriales bacterium]
MNIGKWNIPLILKRLLELMLILSPILLIALPFLLAPLEQDVVNTHISSYAQNRWVTLAFLEICGVFCWLILLFLQKLLSTTIKNSPFVYKNVYYLKYISYLCAVTAVVLIAKTFIDFSILTPVVAVISLLASLFCQTLAAVFDKAIRLKDENDLTI